MSLFRRDLGGSELIWQGLPSRTPRRQGNVDVTADSALGHSAVWAAIGLRAGLISSFPVKVVRFITDSAGELREVEAPLPSILVNPFTHAEGVPLTFPEWLYSSQVDLDRVGNTFCIIRARDGMGFPKLMEPVRTDEVTVAVRNNQIHHYKIGRDIFQPMDIWHERQYTVAGLHVGLSPVAYAAQSLGSYLSAQQFAVDWFGNGAVPGSILKNTAKTLTSEVASAVKKKFQASITNGDTFVTGSDWDYQMIQANAAQSAFLEAMEYGLVDIARFFGVPADMIDAGTQHGTKITYANTTQRNLQFLVLHLGPAIRRREQALSSLLVPSRYARLDTNGLLRMDPAGQQAVIASKITNRQITVSEARAMDNKAPYTAAQIAEFETLFGAPKAAEASVDSLPAEPSQPEGAVK